VENQLLEFDDFRLDVTRRKLLRQGEVVPLYSKAFELLLVLAKSDGLLTKDELLEAVWPGQILEEANLAVTISALRKALGETAAQPHYIVTVPGRGYSFVANVREASPLPAGVLIQTQTISEIVVEDEELDNNDLALTQDGGGLAHATTALPAATDPSTLSRPRTLKAVFLLSALAFVLLSVVLGARYLLKSPGVSFTHVTVRQLTNDGKVFTADISPDGKFFVFVYTDKDKSSLKLGQLSGEQPIDLRPPQNVIYHGVGFTHDGASVLYVIGDTIAVNNVLYRLPILGGVPTKLRDQMGFYFALSPDDKMVAFFREEPVTHGSSLFVSNLDGSSERLLATLPDRSHVAFRTLSWSPDGQTLALGALNDEKQPAAAMFLLSVNTGELKQLTESKWREILRTVWLHDSRGLVIVSATTDAQENRQLWYVALPNGETHRVTSDVESYDIGLGATADSRNILAVEHQQINNIWVGPVSDPSKAKQITFGALNRGDGALGLDWTPDGKIVYSSLVANSQTIWIIDADGHNATELTAPGHTEMDPSVTADGRYIVFESNRSGADEIWRMNADGSNQLQLTSCGKNYHATVSPDGQWVVYQSYCDPTGALWRVPIDGGVARRLTDKPAFWPWISPDSKSIACQYQPQPGKSQLAILSIEGGAPLKLFDVPQLANFRFGIRWTPDGKAVTYRDWGAGLWRQPIDGGAPQSVAGLPAEKIYPYSWSRDGKSLAFTRGVEIRDAILIKDSQ
jgi:Tol biopolymer transport system component/DNA-binding winged helix-turn-helix (wHTH) protein